jgi:anti-sigma B factor antagonist
MRRPAKGAALTASRTPVPRRRHQVVLALEGEFDVAAAAEAIKRLIGIELRPGMELLLDLSGLTFMDSTGIRFVLQARDHALRHAASMLVVPGPERVMRVLELVGLTEQLNFADQPDEV